MSTGKQKKERLITPTGEAFWAHVHKPKAAFVDEHGNVKGDPKYQIDVVYDPKDPAWAAFEAGIDAQIKALPVQTDKKKGKPLDKQSPIKLQLDENDQPTGKHVITCKTGEQFKPGVFDKFGKPIPETVLIGNGSKVRVNYTPSTYEGFGGGINFYFNAVQVIELVEYKPTSAAGYGFECEQAPEEQPAEFGPESESNDGPDDPTVTGPVTEIKPAKVNGKPRFGIVVNGTIYGTYNEAFAQVAAKVQKEQGRLTVTYRDTDGRHEIVSVAEDTIPMGTQDNIPF